jgi:hypothetical protein
MTYTADPDGYTITVDDSSLAPPGDSIITPLVTPGDILVVTYENGDLANTDLPPDTTIPIWVAGVHLTQPGPGFAIGSPWLAAIHVIAEVVGYGSVMGATSNVLTWNVHGPQPGDTPLLLVGASDQADMTGTSPVPERRFTPYWQGISVASDGSWATGFWEFTPTINSIPDLEVSGSGSSSAGEVSTVDCNIGYGVGIYLSGPGGRVQAGSGQIEIDAFIFTNETVVGPPTTVGASWGMLAS